MNGYKANNVVNTTEDISDTAVGVAPNDASFYVERIK